MVSSITSPHSNCSYLSTSPQPGKVNHTILPRPVLAQKFAKTNVHFTQSDTTVSPSSLSVFNSRLVKPIDKFAQFTESRSSSAAPTKVVVPQAPPSLIVGFRPGSDFHSSEIVPSSPTAFSKKNSGLLSRALSANNLALPTSPSSSQVSSTFSFPSFNNDVMRNFPEVDLTLLNDAQKKNPAFHSDLVITAYMVAARVYSAQVTRSGKLLLQHCVDTALTLAELGLDTETVASALLLRVMRGNQSFQSRLEEFMPSNVVQIVSHITTIAEISELRRYSPKSLGDEGVTNMLLAMKDVRAVLVKLAERVCTMREAAALPMHERIALATETLDVFAVVANRLGVWCLKAEMEDLAFAALRPTEHADLKAAVQERQNLNALSNTIGTIKAALDAAGVRYEDLSGRPKSLYGIWKKVREPGGSLDAVHDMLALRIIVASKHDCYKARRVLGEVYRFVPGRSKDFIRDIKKPNGYQSLHETILGSDGRPVEVQIRTHKMHYIAEYGLAAHWRYKEKLDSEDEWLDKQVQWQKWLTNFQLGVRDGKVRPVGSPPTDHSLKALGLHLLGCMSDGSPTDACASGIDPFLLHDRFRLSPPETSHVSVYVKIKNEVDHLEVPRGMTVSQLARQIGLGDEERRRLSVNQLRAGGDSTLESCDLVALMPVT